MVTARPLLRCLLALCLSAATSAAAQQGKLIFGWVEEVVVSRAEFTLHAKLDTGADTSSLDAQRIERFERDGKPWVRFTIQGENTGQRMRLEKPLFRDVLIKRHRGPSQRRPVVMVPLCLGPFKLDVEVSLIDRSHFNYPVLIGRGAMEELAVVDPERAYTRDPDCGDFGDDSAPALVFRSGFEPAPRGDGPEPLIRIFSESGENGPPLQDVPPWMDARVVDGEMTAPRPASLGADANTNE